MEQDLVVGFTTMAVINPPEKKLAKCTSVDWFTALDFTVSIA